MAAPKSMPLPKKKRDERDKAKPAKVAPAKKIREHKNGVSNQGVDGYRDTKKNSETKDKTRKSGRQVSKKVVKSNKQKNFKND